MSESPISRIVGYICNDDQSALTRKVQEDKIRKYGLSKNLPINMIYTDNLTMEIGIVVSSQPSYQL